MISNSSSASLASSQLDALRPTVSGVNPFRISAMFKYTHKVNKILNELYSMRHCRAPSLASPLPMDPKAAGRLTQECATLRSNISALMESKPLSKVESIRVSQWLNKLAVQPNNLVWEANRNFYLVVLREMVSKQLLLTPFINLPPDGPLSKLTIYDVPFPIRDALPLQYLAGASASKRQDQSQSKRNESFFKSHTTRKDVKTSQNQRLVHKTEKSRRNKEGQAELEHSNKENMNICNRPTRKLFPHEEPPLSTMRTEYLLDTNGVNSQWNQLGMNLLVKVLALLRRNHSSLSEQKKYRSLTARIVSLGAKMGVQLKDAGTQEQSGSSMDSSMCSEKATFHETSKQIKDKFSRTDQDTLEFMDYLQGFKRKVHQSIR